MSKVRETEPSLKCVAKNAHMKMFVKILRKYFNTMHISKGSTHRSTILPDMNIQLSHN